MTSEELRAKARAIYARRRPDQTSPIKEDAELMVEALMDEVNALREMVRVTRESYNEARAAHARTDVPALIARVRELEEEQAEAHAVWEQTERTGIHTDGTRELADALGICEGKMTADGVARFALQRVRELEAERPCAIDQLDATMARMELHTVTEERNAFMRSHAILRAIHGALTDALPNTPIPALDSFDVVELVRALAKDMKP